jgi:hypothetical protein
MPNEQKTAHLPVDRLSYSALTQLLRNPLIFKLKYVLNVYDGKIGVSGMVGKAGHEALRAYYGGNIEVIMPDDKAEKQAMAIKIGLDYLEDANDNYIDYGKTGSREQLLKTYHQAMRFYFAEEPEYHEIIMCEERLEAELVTADGQELPLPAVGIPDLVHKRADGKYDIIDVKFTKSFTDYEVEDYIKIVQSQFMDHLLLAAKGIKAERMLFREVKTTENKGENVGTPQIRDYAIPFDHEPYRIIFYNLYRDAVKFLANPDSIYLPNLSDPFDGEQAGLLYAQGLLSSDMSDVEVMHKVKDVALISKRFVPSRLDRIENQHLAPEEKIKMRLAEFGIPVEPVGQEVGASVTQYRFKVSAGIRMSVFAKHKADIARAIEARADVRILAPIPGTGLIGIEVENETRGSVILNKSHLTPGTLMLPIGVDVHGKVMKSNLAEMPHLLIAGSTGSGKSVLINALITAITKQLKPHELELILIDPKRVELSTFAKKPHLHGRKVVYEYDDAAEMLTGTVAEMENRYKALEKTRCRNIASFNKKASEAKIPYLPMPYIVLVIDEFADLMLRSRIKDKTAGKKQTKKVTRTKNTTITEKVQSGKEASVEDHIIRLAQMARAVGIHLIIATQRPSVDVITGLIKANFPTRIALTTASSTDSRVIIDEDGAEKLAGKGDMLYMQPGLGSKIRLQGFITE